MAKTAGVVSLGDVPYSLSADIASKLEQRSAPTQLEKKGARMFRTADHKLSQDQK